MFNSVNQFNNRFNNREVDSFDDYFTHIDRAHDVVFYSVKSQKEVNDIGRFDYCTDNRRHDTSI